MNDLKRKNRTLSTNELIAKLSSEVEGLVEKFYQEKAHFYKEILLAQDDLGRGPLHYAALSKFTWSFKTLALILSHKELPEKDEFHQLIAQVNRIEWREVRRLIPTNYDGILEMAEQYIGK